MDVIAEGHPAAALWRELLGRVQAELRARGAHPSRTVVLLPFAQLMPLARRCWMRWQPDGFAPRFETTMNWAGRLGAPLPGPEDLAFDRGRDLLAARNWLERAGLAAHAGGLAPRLVDAAWQAAGVAASLAPGERLAWAARSRGAVSAGLDVAALALEAAIARIAVEWAAVSSYATDVLFDEGLAQVDLLVVCEGFEADPLAAALARVAGSRAVRLALHQPAARGSARLRIAADAADEAEQAAATVLRHLEAGRAPVALAAVDRVLTRQVGALLDVRGVPVRDETGWKLSTTRAAAQVMAALRACFPSASSDEVLDGLKHLPAAAPATVQALERLVRRAGLRDWRDVLPGRLPGRTGRWQELLAQANEWRAAWAAPRTLPRWQQALRELLEAGGAWQALAQDEAGARVLEALGLPEHELALWSQSPFAGRRLSLGEFTAWCAEVLEGASFVPQAPEGAQVVVLPLHQLLARPFAAAVVPGCDEQRLPGSPEPPGDWTAAQRRALGLPLREQLEQEQRAAWEHLLGLPEVDLLCRSSDAGGEPLLPSPLVQLLQSQGAVVTADDPRDVSGLASARVEAPRAVAPQLVPQRLSASAYEDLRRCPYRFFALRQLGLQEAEEIDGEVDKRDFGNWLHEVLSRFHRALQEQPQADREALLERCAEAAKAGLGLPEGEFLPFEAAWPQVRQGYLAWLQEHEAAEGACFESAEQDLEVELDALRLFGRVDRIDRLPGGSPLVMDYKTESLDTTKARVAQPLEDTQLAFYAALLGDQPVRAAYVNVGERGIVRTVEQKAVLQARDALRAGMVQDLQAIAGGAALRALGEGAVCDWCAARGLCRRDHWNA